MIPLRSIPPANLGGGRTPPRLRSADPKRMRTRLAGQEGQQQNPNTHDPATGEQYHDQYGAGSESQQQGKSSGPASWGGGIGHANRGGAGGGAGSAAAPGSHTYTSGQHLAAKPEKPKTHKALACATCGASGVKLSGSIWYRGVWWVDCLVCDGRQLSKEVAQQCDTS